MGPTPAKDGDEDELDEQQSTLFRAIATRVNYLARVRMDIQYAVKDICRQMAKPTMGAWQLLKQLGKYLLWKPRCIYTYRWEKGLGDIRVFTDANWAGCARTRRSTSSGVMTIGPHIIKTWSRTQHNIALSSAEAELYATGRGAMEAKWLKQLMAELNNECGIRLYTNAKAALDLFNRDGIGKTRHIETQWLWLQKLRGTKYIIFEKVWGEASPADVGTKYLAQDKMEQHMGRLGVKYQEGRAEHAPQLNV